MPGDGPIIARSNAWRRQLALGALLIVLVIQAVIAGAFRWALDGLF